MKYTEENSKIWDKHAENNHIWSVPVSSEVISQAGEGIWNIVLIPVKLVPKDWFSDILESKNLEPQECNNLRILCKIGCFLARIYI